ncbi:hypothetical protein ACH5RR_034636 [Cinchona calisaya]|uniref:Uncharacterized protein n=1 Tax=Cinchona calisaya TaxID=153742 RepID=A0ABD2YF29_9GENT
MASSCFLYSNFTSLLDIKPCKRSQPFIFHPLCHHHHRGISKHQVLGRSSLPKIGNLRTSLKTTAPTDRRSKKDHFAIYCSPETGGGLLPSLPSFWPPTENSWISWLLGLVAIVPFVAQYLLTLTKEVETVAETIEKVADTVEHVAEDVEKLAEDVAEKLPEGSKLKNVANLVENVAKETAKDTQLAEDLLDKVEELDKKVESIITDGSKGANVKSSNE